ncbi:trimeric LpxA-like protein, partial [Ilyonectria sp. MPI-CAGE-AT-0026]
SVAPLVKAPIHMDYRLRVRVAPTAFINRGCTILDMPVGDVSFGERVNIGPNVTIISVGHSMTVDKNSKRPSRGSEVIIGECAWNGAGATLLPDVDIGCHSIIGAGSPVTKNVSGYHFVVGNQAKVMGPVGSE